MKRFKSSLLLILAAISFCKAQSGNGELTLGNNISIHWDIKKFIAEDHRIETCEDDSQHQFICKIDGDLWYGSDMGMEMPRNQLTDLIIHINSVLVRLDTKNMFNPSFDGHLSAERFLLQQEGNSYRLYSFFSDGAGTYTVQWKIQNGSAVREIISNDEKYFDWQK